MTSCLPPVQKLVTALDAAETEPLDRVRAAVEVADELASVGDRLVTHYVDVDIFDERTRTLVEQLQWQLAQRLLQLGQLVVIEWGTRARDERDALRKGARALGAAVELRFLDPPDDVLWDRVRARDAEPPGGRRPLTRAALEGYAASFQRPDSDELSLTMPPSCNRPRTHR